MNSMRYGTLPIVHETGGLADTVRPYNFMTVEGTGFSFYDFDADTMRRVIDSALSVYYDYPEQWRQLIQQAMSENNSWEHAAEAYVDQYDRLVL